jgi:uncharacterized protein (TIGR03083 family)
VDVTAASPTTDESPPAPLRRAVIERALQVRTPGRSVGVVAGSPVDAYGQTAEELGGLLATLGPADWAAPVAAYQALGWTVADLIGHLLAVERYFGALLGVDDFVAPEGTEADHVAMSLPTIEACRRRGGADAAAAAWVAAVASARSVLDAPEPVDLDRRVSFHGFDYRLGSLLVVRAFELWIHGDDIRLATGRPLTLPDPPRLALMTDLAVRAVDRVLRRRPLGAEGERPLIRLVLTGPGGGAWSIGGDGDGAGAAGTGAADRPPADVRIVTDAEAFCRLAARRLPVDALAADVVGDRELARRVLAAAAVLAA